MPDPPACTCPVGRGWAGHSGHRPSAPGHPAGRVVVAGKGQGQTGGEREEGEEGRQGGWAGGRKGKRRSGQGQAEGPGRGMQGTGGD